MKSILLVFTGGTIGSKVIDSSIQNSVNAPYFLLDCFQRQYSRHREVHFKTLMPDQILSENLHPSFWSLLIGAIIAENPEQYDGIIVTHGTDTLAYSAAALSLYFHEFDKPILLVSSDYPLQDSRANGVANFFCAVDYILDQSIRGVFIPYRNQGQPMRVHAGSRLASSLQLSGDFFSIRDNSPMRHQEGRFESALPLPRRSPIRYPDLKPNFADDIVMIRPYPGINYCIYQLSGVTAVLHDLYHSGTACTSFRWGTQHSSLDFIRRCKDLGISVYLAPAMKMVNVYETTRTLLEEGAEMLWNLSLETAYVKLCLAYGNYSDKHAIVDFIHADLAGEHIPD